jgi:hypothetical protein
MKFIERCVLGEIRKNESSIHSIQNKEHEIRSRNKINVCSCNSCDNNIAYSMQFQIIDSQTYYTYGNFE